MPRDADSRVRAVVLVVGVSLGVFLRVDRIALAALFGDEYHTLLAVEESYGTILRTFDAVGSHVVLPLLQKLCLDVFGDGVVSFRLPALVPGILTLLVFHPIARPFVGPTPATLATVALAASPMHVYYSRFGRAYALTVLLALLLGFLVPRAARATSRAGLHWAGVGACAALLPYVHLSTAGFVAGMAVVAFALVWREHRGARALLAPLAAFGAAALVLFALFLPLFPQLRAFREAMPEDARARPLSWFGIPTLLAGGRVAAVVWLVGVPLGIVGLWRSRRDVALVALASVLGPLAALVATMPHGMDYAYARYLLCAQPFALVVLAWLACSALERAIRDAAWARRAALAGGVALVAWGHVTGPLAPGRPSAPAFDNTYLAMYALPAFDEPQPEHSAAYDIVARDESATRVVVTPPLQSRAVLLFRNLAFVHGKEVAIGWGNPTAAIRGWPYVNLWTLGADDADYLILHRDLQREVREYWRFVYTEAWPRARRAGDESFMERQKSTFIGGQPLAAPAFAEDLATRLRGRLGPPLHEDGSVLLWKLAP